MAMSKPTFKVNLGANRKATERVTAFYDLKPDTTTRMRIVPPVTEDGLLFVKITNHFQLKNEEGFGTALACLCEHGTTDTGQSCYLCQLSGHLRSGDKGDKALANKIKASPRWYVQAYIWDKTENSYIGPKLVGLSKTTAEKIQSILVAQDETDDDYFCDPEAGQDLIIKRVGAGLNTEYTVLATGKKTNLDDVIPDWSDRLMRDVLKVIDLKLEDIDGQKRAVYRTFEDELDWDTIQEAIG